MMMFVAVLASCLSIAVAQNPISVLQQSEFNDNQCTQPRQIWQCYLPYLAKYNIHPIEGQLPPYSQLEFIIKRNLDLTNICRDFDELMQCFGSFTGCVTPNAFRLFTDRRDPDYEAVQYVQNHAFFEYVCGPGKQVFLQNAECLSSAFAHGSLSHRMRHCGYTDNTLLDCGQLSSMAVCLKSSIASECGYQSGSASCEAASNIVRREQKAQQPECLYQMQLTCSSVRISYLFNAIIIFVSAYIIKL